MSYFPAYSHSKNKIKVGLHLSNYATKSDLKKATGVDTSQFAKKDNLGNLKLVVDELDFHKLAPVLTDLSKLGDTLKKKVVKKDVYAELVKQVNAKKG